MTPEIRKGPLLDNGSLTHVSMEMRIRGNRLGIDRVFCVNGINKSFHGYEQATNISAMQTRMDSFASEPSFGIRRS
jgi:hypothetical protein